LADLNDIAKSRNGFVRPGEHSSYCTLYSVQFLIERFESGIIECDMIGNGVIGSGMIGNGMIGISSKVIMIECDIFRSGMILEVLSLKAILLKVV